MKYSYRVSIPDLPLILAGPMLRRTETERVTVWLALKAASTVELKIYATEAGAGQVIQQPVAEGRASTIQLGKHLHLVAITARAIAGRYLQPGLVYAYNLWFGDDRIDLVTAVNTENFNGSLSNAKSQYEKLSSRNRLSYFSHQLPTFSLPARDVEQLRLVHSSCRKPHGGGIDTLALLDNLIEDTAERANARPQQLFLTGDQVYGDDVADPFLWLAQGIGNLLLDWDEHLPLKDGAIAASQLPPGRRSETARLEAGLTAMLDNKPEKAKSHLFSLGEYLAAYLLSWSPVLIPTNLPTGRDLFDNSKQAQAWDKELHELNSFFRGLPQVRRALANVATYTICDDHDISDDWYLNREWCDRVLSKSLGRRVLQNGLLSYALCQAWGNNPLQFAPETAGEKLLQTAVRHSAAAGKDLAAIDELERYLGIPAIDRQTGLPQLQEDGTVWILQRDREALAWHYRLRHAQHEVIVLDTRTWRGYPQEPTGIAPPMLLSPTAFQEQLEIPLEFSDRLKHKEKFDVATADNDSSNSSSMLSGRSNSDCKITIVVLPTNLVTLGAIDKIQRLELNRNKVFGNDVGDSWNFNQTAFASLILSLCQRRDRVIILSGDIHFSCAVRLSQWYGTDSKASVLVQLTSSAIKNSEWKTRLVHTKLKCLLPEATENWLVWQNPLKFVRVTWWQRLGLSRSRSPKQSFPDWQYRIEWSKRSPTKQLNWKPRKLFTSQSESPRRGTTGLTLTSSTSFWQRMLDFFAFLLWRNRWFQEGTEVVGHNNISLVRFQLASAEKPSAVIQETYWHSPGNSAAIVKCKYVVPLDTDSPPPLP